METNEIVAHIKECLEKDNCVVSEDVIEFLDTLQDDIEDLEEENRRLKDENEELESYKDKLNEKLNLKEEFQSFDCPLGEIKVYTDSLVYKSKLEYFLNNSVGLGFARIY